MDTREQLEKLRDMKMYARLREGTKNLQGDNT